MIFPHTVDAFNGITVEIDDISSATESFTNNLMNSLAVFRGEGRRVVWLKIPQRLSTLISPAVEQGFVFHNVDGEVLTLTLALVDDANIPPPSTHYVGAGGAVINENRELLVVSERYRRSSGKPHYKLPGGALDPGEHIVDCVQREIREETGIETRFDALVCFRHWHGYRFGKSDIYFVCRLSPLTTTIKMDSEEIAECLWMPLDEYFSRDDIHPFNRRIVRAAIEGEGVSLEEIPGYGTAETHEFFMPPRK